MTYRIAGEFGQHFLHIIILGQFCQIKTHQVMKYVHGDQLPKPTKEYFSLYMYINFFNMKSVHEHLITPSFTKKEYQIFLMYCENVEPPIKEASYQSNR